MQRFVLRLASSLALALVTTVALAQAPGAPGDPEGEGGPGNRGQFRPPLLGALDADNDGEVSAQEIANAAAALKSLDKNSDGKLSGEELRPAGGPDGRRSFDQDGDAGRGPRRDPTEFVREFMRQDKNGDGKVSKEELPENRQRMFEQADTNGDGGIEKSEAKALAQRFQERGPRGPGRDRPNRGERPEGAGDQPDAADTEDGPRPDSN